MLQRRLYSVVQLRAVVVALGVGCFCLLLVTNACLMSSSGFILPDFSGVFFENRNLNLVKQGLYAEDRLLPSSTHLAQQRQQLVAEDRAEKSDVPLATRWQLHQSQHEEIDVPDYSDLEHNAVLNGKERVKGGENSPSTISVVIEHHGSREEVESNGRVTETPKTLVPLSPPEHHIYHSGKDGAESGVIVVGALKTTTHDDAGGVQQYTGKKEVEGSIRAPKPSYHNPVAPHTDSKPASGFILAANYYEQQTMGSRNLLQLQCMAKHLNLAVVKPVMKSSFLKTPLEDKAQSTYLKFEDSFDLDEWVSYAEKASYASLVGWQEFLNEAPRDVVLVRFKYPFLSDIKARKRTGPQTQRAQSDRYQTGCAEKWPSSSELAYLENKKFRIVRKVCFNFFYGDMLTLKEFEEHLFGGYSSANVTVVLDAWRGLGSSQRVLIEGVCASVYPIQEYIQPSQQLVKDAESYIQTYLKGEPYVAIMGRLEMSQLTVHSKEFTVSSCLQETVSELLRLRESRHLPGTFISIDIGKYGTKKWRYKMNGNMSNSLEKFFRSVYGGGMSVKDWETSFEKASSSRDAGYIGLLQKVIVTRARCIVFAGGGAFQRHALHLYRQLDANRNDECLSIVKYCTSSSKLAL